MFTRRMVLGIVVAVVVVGLLAAGWFATYHIGFAQGFDTGVQTAIGEGEGGIFPERLGPPTGRFERGEEGFGPDTFGQFDGRFGPGRGVGVPFFGLPLFGLLFGGGFLTLLAILFILLLRKRKAVPTASE